MSEYEELVGWVYNNRYGLSGYGIYIAHVPDRHQWDISVGDLHWVCYTVPCAVKIIEELVIWGNYAYDIQHFQ